jgi:hypothetical protein
VTNFIWGIITLAVWTLGFVALVKTIDLSDETEDINVILFLYNLFLVFPIIMIVSIRPIRG